MDKVVQRTNLATPGGSRTPRWLTCSTTRFGGRTRKKRASPADRTVRVTRFTVGATRSVGRGVQVLKRFVAVGNVGFVEP